MSQKDFDALIKASNKKLQKAIKESGKATLPGHGPEGSVGKYGNKITKANGKLYHSKGEAERATQLKFMELAGDILHLAEQEPIELDVYCPIRDEYVLVCVYIPDFTYYPKSTWTGNKDTSLKILEDFKGFATDTYKLKRKLLEIILPRKIPNAIFVETNSKNLQCFKFQEFLRNPIAKKKKP